MTPADDLPALRECPNGYSIMKWATEYGQECALAARAKRDAEVERLNGRLLLQRENAEAAKLLHDLLKSRIKELEFQVANWVPTGEGDWTDAEWLRNQLLMANECAEAAEARVKELEHPAVHAPSLDRVKEAHSYMPLDRWPETTKAAHRMYAQSAAPAEEICYLCALIVLLDKAEKRVAELEERLMVLLPMQLRKFGDDPKPVAFRFRRMGAELWNHSDRHPIGFLPNHVEYEVQPLYAIESVPSPDPPAPAPLAAHGVEGEPHGRESR